MTSVPVPPAPDHFRQVMGRFATGVAVVTSAHDGRQFGMTVNSLTSVSLDPCLLLVCLAHRKRTTEAVVQSGRFAVHLLGSHQREVSARFVQRSDDKFDGLALRDNGHGLPILSDCLAYLACTVHRVYDGADHDIVVGRVLDCAYGSDAPLVYAQGRYGSFLAAAE
jgi:3-hydroxy-9,10-secoandrosta-1,3,5(10)-triene-9,17-dione monooxygenase reductase component